MSDLLWQPSPRRIHDSNMWRFMREQETVHRLRLDDYDALHAWSLTQPERFWEAVWRFSDIQASRGWDHVFESGERMLDSRWFTGARLNFAENLLRHRDDHPALIFRNERESRAELSYAELYSQVAAIAEALRRAGVVPGDRVAGFMPNRPETVIAMLATTSLGALWSSCSPDFGVEGVLDRFGQIEPRVLFCADGYYYAGKSIDSLPTVRRLLRQLPSVERVVVTRYIATDPDLDQIENAVLFDDFAVTAAPAPDFVQTPFGHPVYILYSSGTTDVPKCIVHGAGGTLLQHAKELRLHGDLRREQRIFYFTTCGWMMWNWLVSSLSVGSTVVLYDGSPFHPDPGILWRMAEEEQIDVFGTGAKYLSTLQKADYRPAREHTLERLRTLFSTGSPLAPESFDFVYTDIKADLQLSSISGGTDLISCFALGNPILGVYRGEIQCLGLGMRTEIFDSHGTAVLQQKGELVCSAPFPSMPVGFWNDPQDKKYHAAYFEKYHNVWCHGDYAEITAHGGMIIHGRSDAVLSPGGVRIGTAEIYRQVEKLEEVAESIAVGQDWKGDTRVVLFVRLQPGHALDEELIQRIRQQLRQHASPRHVPSRILEVADIPRTISGKIVELAVRNVIHGLTVSNIDALANPEALEYFRDRVELTLD